MLLRWRGAAALAPLLLAAAACRGGGGASSGEPPASSVDASASAFCQAADAFADNLVAGIGQATSGGPSQVAQVYATIETFLRAAAEVAPPDLAAQARTAGDALASYSRALAAAGFDEAKVPEAEQQAFFGPELAAAMEAVAEYSRETCGPVG